MTIARRLRNLDDRAGVRVERPLAFTALVIVFLVLAVGAFLLSIVVPLAGYALMVIHPLVFARALKALGAQQR